MDFASLKHFLDRKNASANAFGILKNCLPKLEARQKDWAETTVVEQERLTRSLAAGRSERMDALLEGRDIEDSVTDEIEKSVLRAKRNVKELGEEIATVKAELNHTRSDMLRDRQTYLDVLYAFLATEVQRRIRAGEALDHLLEQLFHLAVLGANASIVSVLTIATPAGGATWRVEICGDLAPQGGVAAVDLLADIDRKIEDAVAAQNAPVEDGHEESETPPQVLQ